MVPARSSDPSIGLGIRDTAVWHDAVMSGAHNGWHSGVSVLIPGSRILGRFTLERQLGRGGMGVVWLASDEVLSRQVALKLIAGPLAESASAIEELRRETRRSLELTHPNIVRIYDLHADGAVAAIAMEFVDGATLAQLQRERPGGVWSAAELQPWLEQLCAALAYAHSVPRIVHRDIKPPNLMCAGSGDLKIVDFGVSAALAGLNQRLSRVAPVAGTLAYMSPQQLAGMPPAVTDDIFSFGATVYDLVTGRPPFHSGNFGDLMVRRHPPSMMARRLELGVHGDPIPAAWEETIAACLAQQPGGRPRSAEELWACLCGAPRLKRSLVAARVRPTGRREQLVRTVRLHGVGLALGVCVLGVVAVAGVAWSRREGREAPRPAATGVTRPRADQPWEIPDLGMRFLPVAKTGVLFSVWETRVRDFEAFVAATGYDAERVVFELRNGVLVQGARSWRNPGFRQTPNHPVVGVSTADAAAFCSWLTARERAAGRLGGGQQFRLATSREWMMATDGMQMWWGRGEVPPRTANLADTAALRGLYAGEDANDFVGGYDDGFDATAPVGSFPPNQFGLFDLAGNAHEFTGAGYAPKGSGLSAVRDLRAGFRVVCDFGGQ